MAGKERQKDPCRIQLKNVRLSFADIYRAKAFGNDPKAEPGFSANFLIDPKTAIGKKNLQIVEDAIEAAKSAKWQNKPPKLGRDKVCLRDGEDVDYEGYDGMMFLSAGSKKAPVVLDIDKMPVRENDDGAPYSGCFVDFIGRVWAQDNQWGKRVNCSLEAIRFRDDGDAFGARPVDPDEFDDDDDDDVPQRRTSTRSARDEFDGDTRASTRRSRDDDDGEEAPPRRTSRSRDEDDEPPRQSRRSTREDDNDDDERPPRRSSRDEAERPRSRRPADDDEPPARRRADPDDDSDRPSRNSRSRRAPDDDDGI